MPGHIARWKAEHANYRKLLDLLEAQTGIFARGEQPDYGLVADTVHYLTQYADRFHYPREDFAFKRLAQHLPEAARLIDVLARQHRAIEKGGTTLAAELAAVVGGVMLVRSALVGDVSRYVTILRRQLEKEEREIFPQLAAQLTDEDWFLVDSAIHFNADLLSGESEQARFRTIRRQIADALGCGCEDPVGRVCCLD